jgi:hypothetical protein
MESGEDKKKGNRHALRILPFPTMTTSSFARVRATLNLFASKMMPLFKRWSSGKNRFDERTVEMITTRLPKKKKPKTTNPEVKK